jgi:hypothetical protein
MLVPLLYSPDAGLQLNAPREFNYKKVSAATRGFDASRVIENGAFGIVCKGIVLYTAAMVVVKRCTNANANADGAQARAEFLSELCISEFLSAAGARTWRQQLEAVRAARSILHAAA